MCSEEAPAIGIDLGTSYCCVAVYQHGEIKIIENDQGNRTTPSYVAFTEIERLIGESAKTRASVNPANLIFESKRLLGKKLDHPDLQQEAKDWPFKLVCGDHGKAMVCAEVKEEYKVFAPEEVSAMVLTKMKDIAESALGREVVKAVVSVPGCFNSTQRQATYDAGSIAGLDVIRVISEPTAAAFAYGLQNDLKGQRNVLIFDLGGGTLDVSIVNIFESMMFDFKSVAGDPHLGGEDFVYRMVDHFSNDFMDKHCRDPRRSLRARRRLRNACEEAMKTLSSASEAWIEIPSLCEGIDFSSKLTRSQFEEMCQDLFQHPLDQVERALRDAKLEKKQIEEVILIGGATRIPKIREMLKDFFDGKDLCMSLNPDEAVARGAAMQAAAMTGVLRDRKKPFISIDLVSRTIGTEKGNGYIDVIVKRNWDLPFQNHKLFSTDSDYQKQIDIELYEGDEDMARDNPLLGTFTIHGIPPLAEGEVQVRVDFRVNRNGFLKVVPVTTHDTPSLTITDDRTCLSSTDINRMTRRAERFRTEDAEERRRHLLINDFEEYICKAQRTAETSSFGGLNVNGSIRRPIMKVCEVCLRVLETVEDYSTAAIEQEMWDAKAVLDPFLKLSESEPTPVINRRPTRVKPMLALGYI